MINHISTRLSKLWIKISVYKLTGIMQLLLGIGIIYRPAVGTLGAFFVGVEPLIYYFAGLFFAGGTLLLLSRSNPVLFLVGTLPFSMYVILTFWATFLRTPDNIPIQAPVIYITMWILLQILVARENGGNGTHV